ncbi:DUF6624 domain-containing protein [Zobellia laminariae]|uniref:DUF6624 domain-containing protein n=1 Tax=Zobellia laminariae TaxID=248906 RepID=UPI0012D9222C|nr:hypothetical protein [Zobellia laminariae]
MRLKYLAFYLLVIVIISCKNEGNGKNESLRKLSESELLERAEKRISFNPDDVIYKNADGNVISLDSVRKLQNPEQLTTDKFVNKNDEIKEIVVRIANETDITLQKKIAAIYEKEIIEPITPIDVDCSNINNLLTKIYDLDQNMRLSDNHNEMDPKIDRENLIKVISIIEKCGMPTLNDVTEKQMSAIWLVFQHSDNFHRKKYFSLLKNSAENGDLQKSQIAYMEDRMLMYDGKPQIYGSQLREINHSGKLEIYNLQEPEYVDKRRAEVGLGPLGEFLSQMDIVFDVQQRE